MKEPTFKDRLKRQVLDTIARLKRDGTVSASADCLFQNLRLGPCSMAQDAPRGTNAAWQVRQIFNDLVNEMGSCQAFVRD